MAENLKTETAWKRRLPWIAAIVLGTLSILAVNKYLTLQQRGSEQKKVFLLAASADIKPDQELTRNDLEIRSFPRNPYPKSVLRFREPGVLRHRRRPNAKS